MPDVNKAFLSGPVDGDSRSRPRESAPPGRAVAKGRPATAGGRYGQDGNGRGETVAGGREGNPRTLGAAGR